jgi:hypothetical protein
VASSAPDYAGEIAVEGQTQFQLIADIPKANTLVYVDGFRVDPDAYDVAGGALTFATGLAAGSRVVVLKTIVDSARSVDSLFFPLIRVLATTDADSDALIANIDLESGGYDAATPGEFKPGDLRTFEPGVQLDGFDILASGGKAFTNLTFFRCGATGFRNAFFAGIAAGSNIFIVDCTATNWADYGCYADKMHRTCLVGSSFRQKLDALNGPGQKTKNLIGMPNYADHGPYRNPFEYDAVINRCILESRSQWAGVSTVAAHAAQPSIRGIQWSYPGMSVCYSENYSMSAGSFLAAAPPNDTIPYPAHGLLYCGHNWHETTGSRAIETMAPIRSIGNVWAFLGTDYGGDILVFGAPNAEGVYTYDPKIDTSGVHSFHDTFIVEPSKPAASLLFTRQYTVNDGRLNQLRGSATAAGGETALTVTVTLHEYQYERGMYWRIWRSPDGSETLAASEATLTTQAAAYDVTPALPSDIGQTTATVTVALKSGTFAAGERIFITSEWTMETAGYVGQDGAPVMPVSTGETFLRNKAIAIVPEAALVNPLIAIQGDWSEFRIQESEAPLDPAAYRADRYAPISSLYQPLETSAARTAVATVASQTDRTGALRATPRSLGALQPEDDLSDQAPIPEIPVVSIAWSDPAPALGDSITPVERRNAYPSRTPGRRRSRPICRHMATSTSRAGFPPRRRPPSRSRAATGSGWRSTTPTRWAGAAFAGPARDHSTIRRHSRRRCFSRAAAWRAVSGIPRISRRSGGTSAGRRRSRQTDKAWRGSTTRAGMTVTGSPLWARSRPTERTASNIGSRSIRPAPTSSRSPSPRRAGASRAP